MKVESLKSKVQSFESSGTRLITIEMQYEPKAAEDSRFHPAFSPRHPSLAIRRTLA